MNKKVVISLIVAAVLLVIGGVAYAYLQPSEAPASSTEAEFTAPNQGTPNQGTGKYQPDERVALEKPDVITYTDEGFSPGILTVKKGATITVINNSSDLLEFSSDSHPTHKDNSELNMGILQPGEKGTFTVSDAGQFGYHDHLNADNEGIVFVQE